MTLSAARRTSANGHLHQIMMATMPTLMKKRKKSSIVKPVPSHRRHKTTRLHNTTRLCTFATVEEGVIAIDEEVVIVIGDVAATAIDEEEVLGVELMAPVAVAVTLDETADEALQIVEVVEAVVVAHLNPNHRVTIPVEQAQWTVRMSLVTAHLC